jgi:hypothetical protein
VERLGYQLINEQIVAMAAQQADVDAAWVADVEKRKSLMGRMLERIGPASAATASMGAYVTPAIDLGPGEGALRELIRATIEQVAERGRAVIVAHAASYALKDRSDTLRVFLTASPETRMDRLGEDAKQVAKSDGNRADYLKRFYNVSAELPSHYDLVLNTDRLEPKVSVEIIAGLASA